MVQGVNSKELKKDHNIINKSIKIKRNSYDNPYVSRERHRLILVKTMEYLKSALEPKNIDIFAEDVRISLNEISKITGKNDIDDVLDIIFNDFCIGK